MQKPPVGADRRFRWGNYFMSKHPIDIRWQQRFEHLQAALKKLHHAVQEQARIPSDDLIQIALIKTFEITFELSWKTMKDYLSYNGIEAKLPREIIKQAFSNNILLDGQVWIDMLDDRNLMAHVYDEKLALLAVEHIGQRYVSAITDLHKYFLEKLL